MSASVKMLAPAALAMASSDDREIAIHELYRAERAAIARHLLALTGDDLAIEDLVAETFLRAFNAWSSFGEQSSRRTWLHGIAVNVARNHRAKRKRRGDAVVPQVLPQIAGASATSPEQAVADRQAISQLHACIETLEPRLREVFVLRVLEEHSLKEVAAILEIPLSTAHARATKAERLVRNAFHERSDDESS